MKKPAVFAIAIMLGAFIIVMAVPMAVLILGIVVTAVAIENSSHRTNYVY